MKRNSNPSSPGCNLFLTLPHFGHALRMTSRVAAGFVFILLLTGINASSASAQTRTGAKVEERSRRVDTTEGTKKNASNDNQKPVAQPPLVRKTALTYTPRSGNQPSDRTALTNDIVIISRAEDSRGANFLKKAPASAYIPSIWPVVGSLRSGVGMRNNPFGGPGTEFHKGQDISAPMGTPVNVTADGVVVIARWMRGYGNGIYVDHGNGITTRYGHLSRIDVVEGQPVKKGQHLGLVGSTGRSTGPHLHYEVRINGQPTSPMAYLPPVTTPTNTAPASAQPGSQQRGTQH
jgi:murein DD-endopeptidase MepM/ murein hydrolase activator NlpD